MAFVTILPPVAQPKQPGTHACLLHKTILVVVFSLHTEKSIWYRTIYRGPFSFADQEIYASGQNAEWN